MTCQENVAAFPLHFFGIELLSGLTELSICVHEKAHVLKGAGGPEMIDHQNRFYGVF